ncbi:MAG: lamin tail domain-containing protein [Bacteroidales bacterium]|nr:lamin tail domain-containing protein [Bacteroidales bacterium]
MKTLILILFLFPASMCAQIFENFGDGNDTQNPEWFGNIDKFIVNNDQQLQLYDTAAGTAYVSINQPKARQMEWRVWVRLKFSPSANNNLRIYLMSNNKNLEEPLKGYYLQLGEAGSSDALELFRQDSVGEVSVCRGSEGALAKSFEIRIKVLKDTGGKWQIFTDHTGGSYFQKEMEGSDSMYDTCPYFGFECKYTKSNSTKMYFDDVYFGPQVVDTIAPRLISLKRNSDSTLLLNFSENIDSTTAQNVVHYEIIPSCGKISKAGLLNTGKSVQLDFSNRFVSKTKYLLKVSGIKDLSGNILKSDSLSFVYYIPRPHDVVINEIMADPMPAAGLPEYEYLELYNQSDYDIDMSGWEIKTGSHSKIIDTLLLKAKSYLIVSGTKGASSFEPFGKVFAFSSFSLINGGETVSLRNSGGQMISMITYSDDWYRDDDKKKGGWSLEQINPANYCSGAENWKVSQGSEGGTPGAPNSVFQDTIFHPKVVQFLVCNQDSIEVFFSQIMDSMSVTDRSLWQVTSDIGNPDFVSFNDSISDRVMLHFNVPFAGGKKYVLHLSKDLRNCAGYSLDADTSVNFGLPQAPDEKDLVINEVLPDPFAGGVDYLELYNNSDKVLDLSNLQVGYVRSSTSDTSFYPVSTEQMLMFPASYILLSSSPETVKEQYTTFSSDNFLKMERFPNFNSEQGGILLKENSGLLVDAFNYSDKMHFALLKNTKGVSLERLRFEGQTNNSKNWHSASESVGYGTPGYRNSQFESDTAFADAIQINPSIFSPDGDGYQDLLNIKYNFLEAGNTMSVQVYNSQGYLIRHLIKHEYLGTQGSFSWDGLRDDATKALPGIYILYFELYDLQGHVKKYKKAVVLAQKLR